jgi:hypothetical protein
MNNKELVSKAIEAGFCEQKISRVPHYSGEAVSLPKNMDALKRLEKAVPSLKSVADTFHYWLVRSS